MRADASQMTRIQIRVPVRATESVSKVKAAILNVFPDAEITEAEGGLTAQATSVDLLKEMFQRQRIRDAARKVLRSSRDSGGITFSLNKQAAFVGRANFAPPSPLGSIDVRIEDEDVDSLIDYLTGRRRPEAESQPPVRRD